MRSRAAALERFGNDAGFICAQRSGGRWCVGYVAEEQGISVEDGGKYAAVCATHSTLLQVTSKRALRSVVASGTLEFCDLCREEVAPARKFLTRRQATHALGLMDAALRKEPAGVKVACRDLETGEVYEATADEVLHAQIALRVNRARMVEDGWTVPASGAVASGPVSSS